MEDENLLQQETFTFINISLCLFLPVKCFSNFRYNQFCHSLITPTNKRNVFVNIAHGFWHYGCSLLTVKNLNVFLSFSSYLSSFFCSFYVEILVALACLLLPSPRNHSPCPDPLDLLFTVSDPIYSSLFFHLDLIWLFLLSG